MPVSTEATPSGYPALIISAAWEVCVLQVGALAYLSSMRHSCDGMCSHLGCGAVCIDVCVTGYMFAICL